MDSMVMYRDQTFPLCRGAIVRGTKAPEYTKPIRSERAQETGLTGTGPPRGACGFGIGSTISGAASCGHCILSRGERRAAIATVATFDLGQKNDERAGVLLGPDPRAPN